MSDVTSSVFVRMCVRSWGLRIYCSLWKHNPATWSLSCHPQVCCFTIQWSAGSFEFTLKVLVNRPLNLSAERWTVLVRAADFDPHFNVGHLQDGTKYTLFVFVCSWRQWWDTSRPNCGRLWWVWFNELWIQSPRQLAILVMATGQRGGGHLPAVSYGAYLNERPGYHITINNTTIRVLMREPLSL